MAFHIGGVSTKEFPCKNSLLPFRQTKLHIFKQQYILPKIMLSMVLQVLTYLDTH